MLAASTRCCLPSSKPGGKVPGASWTDRLLLSGQALLEGVLEPLDCHMTLAEFLSQLQTQDISEHLELLLGQQDDAG